MHGQRMVDVVVMRLLFLGAVVERIVKFPLHLRCGPWAWLAQKRDCGGQNPCNIIWGYVAWIEQGRGGSNSRRGVGR